ncbi:Creatinase/aminopeptidase [Saccharata proteae CBS 121410]|uniref:Creatinase/aminopeptidase n=1 Tax=Saccharata proteae CBS 121410 TaxID=1314787 RepID=A0A6A5YF51_9PEZI|nr:Creatinase/aminopeptidase [Saccharata proteae CBS 121410]
MISSLISLQQHHGHNKVVSRAQKCTISNLHRNLSFLEPAIPIQASEFIERRDRLAHALHLSNVDAFVLEPGYTFQYYGNISQTDWEPWEPEERPMLMIVQPEHDNETGTVKAKTSFLSPHFEEGRVRMLGIPSADELDIVTWEEHWSPYMTLRKSHLFRVSEQPTVMVDEEMRDYIVRGLAANGFETVGLGGEVEAVRQMKTAAEVELIRAVNTGTVEALRAMRPCLVPGLIEEEVMNILDNALLSIGFDLFFDIVLFEENGALPHGGFVTGNKVLTHDSMVLIDVGAHYLGYSSDVCRSFFIPSAGEMPLWRKLRDPELFSEKLKVWDIVMDAQTESAKMFLPNNTAASVDIAARKVISDAGYGKMFTHRVGHGIGIKAHESPYLNKGNNGTTLRPGMTFTSEPGIYLEGKFGVRHEDIYLVTEDGYPELLSGKRASSPWEP